MSAPTKVQLIGGHFQDTEGNVLAEGSLVMELVQDEQLSNSTGQVCGGIKIRIALDEEGNVAGTPGDETEAAQLVWPTDVMTPSGASYTVWGYAADGQLAWGPNYNLLVPSGATFDVDNWVPNSTGGNTGGNTGGITLQTNGINNGSQVLLDLQEGTNVTIVDNGAGQITISSVGSNGPRTRSWHGWSPDGADSLTPTYGYGCTPSKSGTTVGQPPTLTSPLMLNLSTGNSAGTLAYFDLNANTHTPGDSFLLGILGLSESKLQIPTITAVRTWIGLMNDIESGANFWKSDTPAEPTIAFRFSTAAGDSTWQCVVTDGTTQVVADSHVAIDSNVHTFGIGFTAPNCLFYIDGTLVGTVAITTTTISVSTNLSPAFTVDNVGAANNRSVNVANMYWDTTV